MSATQIDSLAVNQPHTGAAPPNSNAAMPIKTTPQWSQLVGSKATSAAANVNKNIAATKQQQQQAQQSNIAASHSNKSTPAHTPSSSKDDTTQPHHTANSNSPTPAVSLS